MMHDRLGGKSARVVPSFCQRRTRIQPAHVIFPICPACGHRPARSRPERSWFLYWTEPVARGGNRFALRRGHLARTNANRTKTKRRKHERSKTFAEFLDTVGYGGCSGLLWQCGRASE